jgi:hypothetical protein
VYLQAHSATAPCCPTFAFDGGLSLYSHNVGEFLAIPIMVLVSIFALHVLDRSVNSHKQLICAHLLDHNHNHNHNPGHSKRLVNLGSPALIS